ncbi:hypothetical protein PCANC_17201 [Puccinia coronata f. sp. avenae]|uniref:Uncharacterized protein n=1 Tax=Puccinia coronata f. sp. avenae TaxID=200324 RepID=A0A2N5U2A1_9BASI|nr:hypothetical protein PCANC_21710 [Puccinia coronata f. sp. avenae]PLW31853.1 hypothetical protein PCANC_17201 [Puccinia coronata f. sp. avenae]PLW33280.1 hypothetical protein PCASD_09779 [Puccinia coronata f. sp. avenae]
MTADARTACAGARLTDCLLHLLAQCHKRKKTYLCERKSPCHHPAPITNGALNWRSTSLSTADRYLQALLVVGPVPLLRIFSHPSSTSRLTISSLLC